MRRRRETLPGSGNYEVVQEEVEWEPRKTAIVICDLWDRHWCMGATQRVDELAPAMDTVVANARARGVLIIHAPSDTVAFYTGTPARKRAQEAPLAPAQVALRNWMGLDPALEPPLPIDDSDGGCDDSPQCAQGAPWTRQHPALQIDEARDAISDDGQEVYNLLQKHDIENVIVMGVHTNMCVLGRPFGIRRLVGLGKRVALARDLTDTMYNSRRPPYVSHFRGTDRVVEHIEKHWCPSFTSDQITGGPSFRFAQDHTKDESNRIAHPSSFILHP
jgi:nicotinamidase-related amidase